MLQWRTTCAEKCLRMRPHFPSAGIIIMLLLLLLLLFILVDGEMCCRIGLGWFWGRRGTFGRTVASWLTSLWKLSARKDGSWSKAKVCFGLLTMISVHWHQVIKSGTENQCFSVPLNLLSLPLGVCGWQKWLWFGFRFGFAKSCGFRFRFGFTKLTVHFAFSVRLGLRLSVDVDAIFHLRMTLEMTYIHAELVQLIVSRSDSELVVQRYGMKKNTLTDDPIMLQDELWMRQCEKRSPNCQSRFFENQTAWTIFSFLNFELGSVRFLENDIRCFLQIPHTPTCHIGSASFGVLTLLCGWQESHTACKKFYTIPEGLLFGIQSNRE